MGSQHYQHCTMDIGSLQTFGVIFKNQYFYTFLGSRGTVGKVKFSPQGLCGVINVNISHEMIILQLWLLTMHN